MAEAREYISREEELGIINISELELKQIKEQLRITNHYTCFTG